MDIKIKTVKEAVDKAKYAVDSTQEYINKAKDITKAGGTLSSIQSLAGKLDKIGQASFVLGAISAGMELAIFMSGEPTIQEKMMSMLENLSSQIEELKSRMDAQFERLMKYSDYKTLNDNRRDYSGALDACFLKMKNYNNFLKEHPNPDPDDLNFKMRKDDLLKCNTGDIFINVQKLSNLITGDKTIKGIFDVTIDYSYGDIRLVMDIGNSMLSHSIAAMQLDALIHSIVYEKDVKEIGKEAFAIINSDVIGEQYQPLIKNITDGFRKAIDDCTYNTNIINTRAKKYCEMDIFPVLKQGDLDFSACYLGEKLSEQWPWYSWAVITYEDSQFASYAGSSFGYDDQKVSDGKLCIVVSKIDTELPSNIEKLTPFYKEARKRKKGERYFSLDKETTQFQELGYSKIAMLWLHDDQTLPSSNGNKAKFGFYTSNNNRTLHDFYSPKNQSSWIAGSNSNAVLQA
jgi:hypothetical protein